jgi:hypothetical protein
MIKTLFNILIFVSIFLMPQNALAICASPTNSPGSVCSGYDKNTCELVGCIWYDSEDEFLLSQPPVEAIPPATVEAIPPATVEAIPPATVELVPSGGQTSNAGFVADVQLINPITGAPATGSGIDLIAGVAKNLINTLLGLVGIFAMIGFIWGGVTWMTSYGDTAKIDRGKKMMIWALVGLMVIFSSYAIANYIFQAIGAATVT